MKYIIQKKKHSPAYLQLYSQVREDIIRGVYPYNAKLPSKRITAEELGISTVTVEHAYSLLCDEGYIESRERSGYFVIFRTDDGFAAASRAVISLPAPQPNRSDAIPEFPLSVLTGTMRRVMSDFGQNILKRSPNAGCEQLRLSIAQYLDRSRGISADPRQIIIGSGSEYLYTLIAELLGRGRTYAIESPSYKKIEQVYTVSEVCYERLPLGADGIKSDALWASRADVLHITPYRSFPSGVTASASKRHEYIRWVNSGDRYIVEDDFESEFSVLIKPEETLFSLSKGENVIYMNTFSRTVSPSLRVGYIVLPKRLLPVFEERLGFFSCTVPTYIQLVLAELIAGGDFERQINRVRRKKRKKMLDAAK